MRPSRPSREALVGIIGLLLCTVLARALSPGPGPRLSAWLADLTNRVVQPATGRWNPATGEIAHSDEARNADARVFCGPVLVLSFPTATDKLYAWETCDELPYWRDTGLQIVGTGEPVALYDTPNTRRFYRLKEVLP